ncbi:hypothetical protein [Flavobacterium hibisci]|uniref:hypothetical protein n=1 Tax=Flavobacterium hibisci TaxID=1914462 RepID=UPI001CBD82CD|nr:hypothetical protein [Flavobacterium hibisci]MBZ4040765.1 hypothetical protein [Flavobacterium hibisci]
MKAKVFFLFPILLLFLACESDDVKSSDNETLKEITYEVVLFEFIADTGNGSSRLRYNIKFNNPNKLAIKGTTSITLDYNGVVLTPIKKIIDEDSYIHIGANSSYTEVYDVVSPHETNLLSPEQIKAFYVKFVSAKFIVAE